MADEQTEQGKQVSRTESGRPERISRAMSPFEEIDRMFENFFPQAWMRPFRLGRWMGEGEGMWPRVDVIDRDNEILVRAEIPGVDKDAIDVSVTDGSVTIKGSAKHEREEEHGEYYRAEISHGAFSRTISLPSEVSADGASAGFNNGVLELKLPKVEKSKRRSIPVS